MNRERRSQAVRGVDGRLWPWGNNRDFLAANWGSTRDGFEVTAPVGSFKRDVSQFGIADGAGNVMEWVADWYAEDSYRDPADNNPLGPEHGLFKVRDRERLLPRLGAQLVDLFGRLLD